MTHSDAKSEMAWNSDSMDISSVPVLDEPECCRALHAVDDLREIWTRRSPLPFFTLGAASYIDAAQSRLAYQALAVRHNGMLDEKFGWLYERVFATLAPLLGGCIVMHPSAARPGFHIYLAHKAFEQAIASTHLDSQYELVDWSQCTNPDFGSTASFTLALELPLHGGGLYTWDVHRREIAHLDQAAIARIVANRSRHYIDYRIGHMAFHSGHIMHQVAPARHLGPQERRITLQGHCTRAGDVWYAYW
jgi:hypothetical protein